MKMLWILAILIVVSGFLFYDHQPLSTEVSAATSTPTEVSRMQFYDQFYNLPPKQRSTYLYQMNVAGDYRGVVTATDEGIQDYKDVVRNDVDFWNHRGYALYQLGECIHANTSFWHASGLDINNKIASEYMAHIGQNYREGKGCGAHASTTPSK